MGVNIFFVLSGFLITSLLLGEWAKRLTIHLGQFWARQGEEAAARPVGDAGRCGHLRQGVRHAGRVRRPTPRFAVDPLLCGQLALHLRGEQLLRPGRTAVAPRAHVVALDRGAVLHRLATGRPGHAPPGPPAPAIETVVADLRHRGGRGAGVGPRHAAVVLRPRLGDPPLRGHRHPLPGHPGRRGTGHRDGYLGPAPAAPVPDTGRPATAGRPEAAGSAPPPPPSAPGRSRHLCPGPVCRSSGGRLWPAASTCGHG